MSSVFLHILGFSLLGAILCGMYRAARGPTVLDRLLAFDLIVVSCLGITVLLGIEWKTTVFVEWILVISLLGFLTTVTMSIYLMKSYPDHKQEDEAEKSVKRE